MTKIVHIKDKHFSYSGVKAYKSTRSVDAVNYRRNIHRLEQIAEAEAVKEQNETTLKKDWREEVHLPAKLEDHRPGFLECFEEVGSIRHIHLRRINLARHRINLLNDETRPVHSAPLQMRPTARRFAVAETD